MKISNYLLFFLCTIMLSFYSCGSDDENGGGAVDPPTSTCCQVPHLEACIGGAKVFVPNAFTPNGDGLNDLFLPFTGTGISEIESFKIFEADGTIVFEKSNFQGNDPANGWDGTLPDGTIVDGVFSYTISIKNVAQETEVYDGEVCCRVGDFPCVDLEKHCVYGAQHDGKGSFLPDLPSFENCQ